MLQLLIRPRHSSARLTTSSSPTTELSHLRWRECLSNLPNPPPHLELDRTIGSPVRRGIPRSRHISLARTFDLGSKPSANRRAAQLRESPVVNITLVDATSSRLPPRESNTLQDRLQRLNVAKLGYPVQSILTSFVANHGIARVCKRPTASKFMRCRWPRRSGLEAGPERQGVELMPPLSSWPTVLMRTYPGGEACGCYGSAVGTHDGYNMFGSAPWARASLPCHGFSERHATIEAVPKDLPMALVKTSKLAKSHRKTDSVSSRSRV